MSKFNISSTSIEGLKIIERVRVGDSRGFFSRIFCAETLKNAGWEKPISQINQTFTENKGVIRGMHFQNIPHAEMKLVSCLHGKVWDVVVDLRKGSPTFLKWHAEILSEKNCRGLMIPEGCAHGFQALENSCELIYLHSTAYAPDFESGIHPNDLTLAISWPLDVYEISSRDAALPFLDSQFYGITI